MNIAFDVDSIVEPSTTGMISTFSFTQRSLIMQTTNLIEQVHDVDKANELCSSIETLSWPQHLSSKFHKNSIGDKSA